MELNKLVFAGLALGCLGAAAGGGYLAARQSTPVATAAAVAPANDLSASTAPAPGTKAVAESEGVIAPEPPVARPAEPAVTPAAVRTEPAPASRRTTPVVERRAPSAPSRSASAPARSTTPPESRTARNEVPTRQDSSPSPSSGGSAWEVRPPVEPERAPVSAEPETPPAPAAPELVELQIPVDSVIGLQVERTISSETARVEDRVEARVTRDVRVGDKVAIPAGSVVQGSVMEVERGGKVKERAKLGIRFHTVVLADGTRLGIRTDSIVREGASPTNESAAKIGGAAVGGAILGAILGGGKGAVIGGTVGAAGGTAATMAGNRNPAILAAGSTVNVRVQQPVTVTVEKK
jgi:hypothetical protein